MVIATLVAVSAIIGIHYEVLRNCLRLLPAIAHRRRRRVIVLILVIMLTHVIEIWIFGLAYYLLLQFDSFGSVTGTAAVLGVLDFVYYSAMVYTTVGFGDLFPEGPIRFMTGVEALTGLVMIGWSASFTYLEMRRDWRVGLD